MMWLVHSYIIYIIHFVSFTSLSLCKANCSPTGQVPFYISFDLCKQYVSQFSSLDNKMHMGGCKIAANVFVFFSGERLLDPPNVNSPPPQTITHPLYPWYRESYSVSNVQAL